MRFINNVSSAKENKFVNCVFLIVHSVVSQCTIVTLTLIKSFFLTIQIYQLVTTV